MPPLLPGEPARAGTGLFLRLERKEGETDIEADSVEPRERVQLSRHLRAGPLEAITGRGAVLAGPGLPRASRVPYVAHHHLNACARAYEL